MLNMLNKREMGIVTERQKDRPREGEEQMWSGDVTTTHKMI